MPFRIAWNARHFCFLGSLNQRFGEEGGGRFTTFALLGRFPNCVRQGLLDRTGSHAILGSNGFAVGSLAPCVRGLHRRNTVRVLLSELVSQRMPRDAPDLWDAFRAYLGPRCGDVCLCEARVVRCCIFSDWGLSGTC